MPRCPLILATLFVLPLVATAAERVTHRVLAADRGKGHIAILDSDGKVEWEMENKHDVHDLQMLPNGNILTHTSSTDVVEIDPKKKEIVWKYEAKPKEGYKGRIEIHAFQRLDDGNTMVAESGNTRIVEVDKAGKIVKEIPLKVKQPNAHRDTRRVRKLASGNYLVCHEGEGAVVEYDGDGKVVWSYKLDLGDRKRSDGHGPEGHGVEVFGAIRLENGNTMIAGGNNNRVLEVDPKGKIVWQIDQKDLPGITLAWVTTLQVLPSGNIVIGNCHAGPENPQLIEVTKEKKVVWTMKDHKVFGNDTASALIIDSKSK
jgi:outer membrane protein assembly factor BamB